MNIFAISNTNVTSSIAALAVASISAHGALTAKCASPLIRRYSIAAAAQRLGAAARFAAAHAATAAVIAAATAALASAKPTAALAAALPATKPHAAEVSRSLDKSASPQPPWPRP